MSTADAKSSDTGAATAVRGFTPAGSAGTAALRALRVGRAGDGERSGGDGKEADDICETHCVFG